MIDFRKVGNTPEELQEAIRQLAADFDAHNHDGFNSKKFETINVQTLSGEVITIRKSSFGDTRNGIWMGIVRNVVKFIIGNSSNFISWDGTTLTMTGSIVGSSIYIPSVASPLFSVDVNGNVEAKSLLRKDFHWFTLFESIDGYLKVLDGTGTIVLNPDSVDLSTGNVSGNLATFIKSMVSASSIFSWDKRRKMKVQIRFIDVTNINCFIVSGDSDLTSTANNKIGFYLSDDSLYGVVGNGTTFSTAFLGTIGASYRLLEVNYIPGVGAYFYDGGTLVGSITSNLPSGTNAAHNLFGINMKTNANAVKQISVNYLDFWQAN